MYALQLVSFGFLSMAVAGQRPLPGCPHVWPPDSARAQYGEQTGAAWPTWSAFNPMANRRQHDAATTAHTVSSANV